MSALGGGPRSKSESPHEQVVRLICERDREMNRADRLQREADMLLQDNGTLREHLALLQHDGEQLYRALYRYWRQNYPCDNDDEVKEALARWRVEIERDAQSR